MTLPQGQAFLQQPWQNGPYREMGIEISMTVCQPAVLCDAPSQLCACVLLVSLVDGYDLPMSITPNASCPVASCPVDLGPICMSIHHRWAAHKLIG